MSCARKVYWAGDLFGLKDLIGNRMLADAFDRQAAGRWQAVLPQEIEANGTLPGSIRDNDLELLFASDAIVANFDGADLDSGMVAEFCFAKFLDLSAVLLRTDFRNRNDAATCPDPWNLVCSGFPRSEVVLYDAMKESGHLDFASMTEFLAAQIVQALDRCVAAQPVAGSNEAAFAAFRHAVRSAGGTVPERFPDERIRAIVEGRRNPEREHEGEKQC